MSNIKTSKKIILIALGILLVLSLLVGVSYAYYMVTHSQTNSNIVKSTCISLSLTNEQNDISLDKQYPISDEDGASLTPYSFTITNTCRNAISYNLNLEMLEGTTLDSKYVKTMINTRGTVNLSNLATTDTSINTSTEARTLTTGVLSSEESINYEFRMWMDGSTEADTNSMNKEFLAKIVVTGVPTKVYNFDYTGTEQVFTAPADGTYKLETWGAQGGSSLANGEFGNYGGYGGYSVATFHLNKNQVIYAYVGGAGVNAILEKDSLGGYNGGGLGTWDKSDDETAGGGGGATDFRFVNGDFDNINSLNSRIIIAGGGGGASWANSGGYGGGFKGGIAGPNGNYSAQTSGYKLGVGENAVGVGASDGIGGGGGGYYGGYCGIGSVLGDGTNGVSDIGGGGSGYIGNSLLTNKAMYCYNCEESSEENTKTISTTCAEETPTANCAKKGNGYAKITYIG